jgi:ubiquitin C-terminal hydrolase
LSFHIGPVLNPVSTSAIEVNSRQYRLRAIVVYCSLFRAGHYYAYVRPAQYPGWLKCAYARVTVSPVSFGSAEIPSLFMYVAISDEEQFYGRVSR